MSNAAKDQATVLQLACFRNYDWGQVVVYQSCPHVLITKLFQPSRNCVISIVKQLCKICWCKIRALTYDLHQLIHNFKSHAPLQRFVWWITDPVLQLLKSMINTVQLLIHVLRQPTIFFSSLLSAITVDLPRSFWLELEWPKRGSPLCVILQQCHFQGQVRDN